MKISRFSLDVTAEQQTVSMPAGAQILYIDFSLFVDPPLIHTNLFLWALCDENVDNANRTIMVVSTDESFAWTSSMKFIGTAIDGSLEVHAFEVLS